MQAAPGSFQLLEVGVVHDGRQLLGQLLIERAIALLNVTVRFLPQVTVPLSASSVSVLINSWAGRARSAWSR